MVYCGSPWGQVLMQAEAGCQEVSVGLEETHCHPCAAMAPFTFVVWLRPLKASIMTKDVPNCMETECHLLPVTA